MIESLFKKKQSELHNVDTNSLSRLLRAAGKLHQFEIRANDTYIAFDKISITIDAEHNIFLSIYDEPNKEMNRELSAIKEYWEKMI